MFTHPDEPSPPTATAAAEAGNRLGALSAALARRIAAKLRAAAHRRAARRLFELEPHLLKDVGLTKADLRRAMRGDGPDA